MQVNSLWRVKEAGCLDTNIICAPRNMDAGLLSHRQLKGLQIAEHPPATGLLYLTILGYSHLLCSIVV